MSTAMISELRSRYRYMDDETFEATLMRAFPLYDEEYDNAYGFVHSNKERKAMRLEFRRSYRCSQKNMKMSDSWV